MTSETQNDDTYPTEEQIIQAFNELECLGKIKKTGEFRDGRPVYVHISVWRKWLAKQGRRRRRHGR